jgi:hypothetical protein
LAEEIGKELQPPAAKTESETNAPLGTAERPMQVEIHAPRTGLLTTLGSPVRVGLGLGLGGGRLQLLADLFGHVEEAGEGV